VAVASQMQPVPGTPTSRWHTYRRNLLGFAYCELGRLDEAERLLQECLQNWHELGDFVPADFCRLNLARVTWKRGRLEDAWREYQDVTAAFGRWNERRGMAYATEGLGRVAADLGRYAESARLLGAAQRLRESIGLRRDFADAEGFERAVDASCAALGPTYTSEWQAGYGISPDRVPHWISGLD
jgi:tetratricopeptide (TPR) repeat protein